MVTRIPNNENPHHVVVVFVLIALIVIDFHLKSKISYYRYRNTERLLIPAEHRIYIRWKIITGKLLSLLAGLVVSGLLLYLACILANGVFFGFGSGTPYIYASNGTAYVMNSYLFWLLKILISLIPMLIYMVFAFMLSVITRNTAASVGISIAVYFAGGT